MMQIPEKSLLKRDKIKKDLIKILQKHGFKRSFFKHPASMTYVKGDLKAKVYSKTQNNILTDSYDVAGVEIDAPTQDPLKIEKELTAYQENYLKKKSEKPGQKYRGLEAKFGIFAAFIIGGIALGLGSLTITGNAVSNLSQTTPGLLGIILFIAGLAGMFFCSRKK